jgi:hypothetical protein
MGLWIEVPDLQGNPVHIQVAHIIRVRHADEVEGEVSGTKAVVETPTYRQPTTLSIKEVMTKIYGSV